MLRFRLCNLLLIALLACCVGSNELCKGTACGNKQFGLPPSTTPVKFLVYSAWISNDDVPLNVNRLNHKIYCDANGYEYRHFFMTRDEFVGKYGQIPPAWLSVYAAQELLTTSDADYFFKLDPDCVFVRMDVRLESLIDPLGRYSFYLTNTEGTSRFMQSQSWILKRSENGIALIREWLDYAHWGNCNNLAYEQGGMHLMIGMAYSWYLGSNGTKYDCPRACKFTFSVFLAVSRA